MKTLRRLRIPALVAIVLCAGLASVSAQSPNAKIANTKHNLSANPALITPGWGLNPDTATDSRVVKSDPVASGGTDQICVFCHTPHAGTMLDGDKKGPLWNRKLSGETYRTYTSNSFDAKAIAQQPGGASKLCLSCHDGTLALGAVNVLGGKSKTVPGLTGTMPDGGGTTSGFTRNLGIDLRNDHPISFKYDSVLASADGELRSPPYSSAATGTTQPIIGIRSATSKPLLPLDHNGHLQCTTCHDPHFEAQKFLRLSRLQKAAPTGGAFNSNNDQICLGCHDKLGTSWSKSAHADPLVADEAYTNDAADRREFRRGTKVWEAACLNCHDTHTAQGTRRLLREGVTSGVLGGTGSGQYKAGSSATDPASVSAIEDTCYQCHQGTATKVIGTGNGEVPNIKSEFEKARRMPIGTGTREQGFKKGATSTADTWSGTERHDISNADFMETPEQLGSINHDNRHVECTDCHNPHRVVRNSLFNGLGDANARTHTPAGINGNLASGALRGTWGVEPVYGDLSAAWPNKPTSYVVKSGDPKNDTGTDRSKSYLTREYQLCFKCHSDYGAGSTMPQLGYTGGTPSGTNGLTRYTNIAAEFAVNAKDYTGTHASLTGTDQCETGNATECTSAGSPPGDQNENSSSGNTGTQNHRSWHPVHYPTGRNHEERGVSSTTSVNFKAPWVTNLGFQTMQCSDCHGAATTGVQGPHGSANNFLLKGTWTATETRSDTFLCTNCHRVDVGTSDSGFGAAATSGHASSEHSKRCGRCHIAVPHGWRNKAFLVNLNCAGTEAGYASDCQSASSNDGSWFTKEPYYIGAFLRIRIWQRSRAWTESSCGTTSGSYGEDWMSGPC